MRRMFSKNQIEAIAKVVADDEIAEIPPELPDYEEASAGDLLTIGEDGEPEWQAPQPSGEEVIAYEGTSLMPTGVIFKDWSLHRGIKDGNILWLAVTGVISNTNASSASVSGIISITIPSDLGDKIYRSDGTKVSVGTSYSNILYSNVTFGSGSRVISLYSNSQNELKIEFTSTQTLGAATDLPIDIRIPIFLDIGTNGE